MVRRITLAIIGAAAVAGCSSSATAPTVPRAVGSAFALSALQSVAGAFATNTNGVGGAMPAYYDGTLFTINFKELSSGGESATLARNGSINIIYQSDRCMPGGQMFVSVLDAIQGDGFNPLWREVQVVFKNPSSCQQFRSDDAIKSAAAAGVVTLVPTTEVYRCSVIGKPS